jgi:hypothetical protein
MRTGHPIVRRELELLPAFLGRDYNLRTVILFAALAALGIGPCSCLCGGVLTQGLVLPLSLLPIIWAGQVINRDVVSGQWSDLRLTPFSVSEVVLAKLFAVVHRLGPLLTVIVAVQFFSSALAAVFSLFLSINAFVMVNGTPLQTSEIGALSQDRLPLLLIGGAVLLVVTVIQAVLDFLLNVAVGVLASALTRSRGLAFGAAVALRVTVSIGLAAIAFVLAGLLSGQVEGALLASSALGLGSGQLLLTLGLTPELGGFLLALPLVVVLQAGALYGAVRLTIWRAAQLQ